MHHKAGQQKLETDLGNWMTRSGIERAFVVASSCQHTHIRSANPFVQMLAASHFEDGRDRTLTTEPWAGLEVTPTLTEPPWVSSLSA